MIVLELTLLGSNLLDDAEVFVDRGSLKSAQFVMTHPEVFQKTKASQKEYVNFGYIFEDSVWVKFKVHNSNAYKTLKKVVVNNPNVDILNLHSVENEKIVTQYSGVLQRQNFEKRLFFNFDIALQPDETKILYLEYKAVTHSTHFSLKLQTPEQYFNSELKNQLILISFFGALIALIIYNLVLFFISKNSIYAYYSIFVFSLFVHHLTLSGTIYYLLPTEYIVTHSYTPIYYIAFSLLSAILFVYKFLSLKNYKKIKYTLFGAGAIMIVMLVLSSPKLYLLKFATSYALLFSLSLEVLGIYLFFKRNSLQDRYFVIAWSVVWIGIIATLLFYLGAISKPIAYLYELSIVGEALLFSVVLGKQLNEQGRIIQDQAKLASMGEMIQNIAHQWRQPLSEINSVAMKIEGDFLQKKLTQENLDANLEQIEMVTTYMSQTIEDFTHYFREDNTYSFHSLDEVVNKAIRLMKNSFQSNNIEVKTLYHDRSAREIIEGQLIQVLVSILNNAKDALLFKDIENRVIMIEVFQNKITVEDSGGGIKKAYLQKVFEPYFTTKFQSKGVGVGLYMSKVMIEKNMGGSLSVKNSKLGAKFTIEFF